MARPNREYVAAHRLRKKISRALVPGSVRVTRVDDNLVIEAEFTKTGWEAIEKLAALRGMTGQQVYEDSLRRILAKTPVKHA